MRATLADLVAHVRTEANRHDAIPGYAEEWLARLGRLLDQIDTMVLNPAGTMRGHDLADLAERDAVLRRKSSILVQCAGFPQSSDHNEHVFLRSVHACELVFYLVRLIAFRTTLAVNSRESDAVFWLDQLATCAALITGIFHVLKTLSPQQFMSFREATGAASALQSVNFHLMEIAVYGYDPRKTKVFERPRLDCQPHRSRRCDVTHMSPEEFRRYGYRVVDWIVDYWTQLESFPVAPSVEPGDILSRLPAHPPEQGESFDAVLSDLDEILVPGLLHWQHPRFFGYFPANSSGPAVLADLLCAGLGVQGMLWVTSPACTELEQRVLDWLAEALGLPERFRSTGPGGGVIQDSASSSVILAVLAAMHQASAGRVRREGVATHRYVLYATAEAHSSVTKAALVTGLGEQAIRQVATRSGDPVMEVAHLRELVTADLAAGNTPLLTVATVGTTSTCAVDPVPDIGAVCREHGMWLHVDAAYAGVAAVCPELRWLNDGVAEFADSYCTNPHKWLLTNFDCDTFWVADRAALTGALSVLPEFLRNRASDSGRVTDYRDWQIPLGRRFRALKLWAVMRWYGMTGLRAHIERGIGHAQQLTRWITADDRFELTAPQRLSLVCFRLRAGRGVTAANLANLDLLARVNATGITFLTHTKIDDLVSLRFATGATYTELHHVEQAWHCVQKEAADLLLG